MVRVQVQRDPPPVQNRIRKAGYPKNVLCHRSTNASYGAIVHAWCCSSGKPWSSGDRNPAFVNPNR